MILQKMAAVDINVCNVHSETVIRQCAEKAVRSELCPCASSVDSIVDAVVEEYLRQSGSGNGEQLNPHTKAVIRG